MLLYAIIFLSGGAILALELLASRIMTPYFGVSLYIWTGILSITLVALALGYVLGGRFARNRGADAPLGRLLMWYALMPAIASAALVAACLAYPRMFSPLAAWNLVAGAFVACIVLLFVPLVAAAAMNPLLVAIALRRKDASRAGDAGAGKVFFASTIGSVAGVFVTAFALIPYVTNFSAVLTVAIALALLALAAAVATSPSHSGMVMTAALLALLAAVGLMWSADAYTGRQGPFAYAGTRWHVEAAYGSLFGTVKVLRSESDGDSGRFARMYFQDGLTQNTVDSANRSASFYTYALEALARAYAPHMRKALVLGLGAGMVPMRLVSLGVSVDVVDIDPAARAVAQRFFGFDPARATPHQADARTFLRGCSAKYDVVVVDLFHGDGTPDYLVTREFFADLKRCMAARGVAVFNTFADTSRPASYAHLLVTLKSALPHLALYRPYANGSTHVNSFIAAAAAPLPSPAQVTFDYVPPRHERALWDMLAAPTPLAPVLFEGGRIVTDAVNPAAHEFAQLQLAYRRSVVEGVPATMLLN
ncbi:MAG: spermidine synthase [Burkholderiales bacterium]